MPLRTRILWLASGWILLGSGCDYWQNLIEAKKEDRVDLVLSVKDAWTGEALSSARCSVDGAAAVAADAEGRIAIPSSSTGSRSVDCSCDSYHGRAMTVDARPGAGRIDIPMARMGGGLWYPEDPSRQVRIEIDSGKPIFPGDLVVQGLPGDAREGIFQYTWSSTHHSGLKSQDKVRVRTDPRPEDTLKFTLNLTVTATLAGRTYEVGTDSQTFTLAKNRPPTLTVQGAFKPVAPVRVGTGCEVEPVALHLNAFDPDGECRIHISSRSAEPPLGHIDTTTACSQQDLSFYFPIIPHYGPGYQRSYNQGQLDVEVTDGNFGAAESTFKVVTYTNMDPTVTIEQLDARVYNLTDEEMKFSIVAEDRDTMFLREVSVDWKDGTSDPPIRESYLKRSYRFEDTLIHIFRNAGTYEIVAKVVDGCGVVRTAKQSIELVDNRVPTVSVEGRRFIPGTQEYEVLVKAFDGDAASGMDSLTVVVTWGAMTDSWMHQDNKVLVAKNINETVAIPFRPVPNATSYLVYVSALDQFRGTASDTLRLTPEQAFGAP